MTRDDVMDALSLQLCAWRGAREGDALADLLALAYPDLRLIGDMGRGEPLMTIRPRIEAIIAGWTEVSRLNTPGAKVYRDAVAAASYVLGRAEMAEALRAA